MESVEEKKIIQIRFPRILFPFFAIVAWEKYFWLILQLRKRAGNYPFMEQSSNSRCKHMKKLFKRKSF